MLSTRKKSVFNGIINIYVTGSIDPRCPQTPTSEKPFTAPEYLPPTGIVCNPGSVNPQCPQTIRPPSVRPPTTVQRPQPPSPSPATEGPSYPCYPNSQDPSCQPPQCFPGSTDARCPPAPSPCFPGSRDPRCPPPPPPIVTRPPGPPPTYLPPAGPTRVGDGSGLNEVGVRPDCYPGSPDPLCRDVGPDAARNPSNILPPSNPSAGRGEWQGGANEDPRYHSFHSCEFYHHSCYHRCIYL